MKNTLSVCPACSSKLHECTNCGTLVFYKAELCPKCGVDPQYKPYQQISSQEKSRTSYKNLIDKNKPDMTDNPLEILKRRLALGEINFEEYDKLKDIMDNN